MDAIDQACAKRIVAFLNSVGNAEEIADRIEFQRDRAGRIRIARQILRVRAELGGSFKGLDQVANVEQLGPKRFAAMVRAICGPGQRRRRVRLEDAMQALELCVEDFMRLPQVVAVAVGLRTVDRQETNEICVKAFVVRKLPASELPAQHVLPTAVFAADRVRVAVDVDEMMPPWAAAIGLPEVGAHGTVTMLRQRVRPAMGGYSVAHIDVTAGTIATVVRDRHDPTVFYILSNNHVLANVNRARLGDPILQPGPADGGRCPRDLIGRLCRFEYIHFTPGATNLIDAAIADINFGDVERRIYCIGYPRAVRRRASVQLGEELQKTGRTTGYTTGRVIAVHGTVDVNYSGGRVGRFRQQIFTTPMSAGGDSGSLVLDVDENALGLLFAGSSTHTILNYVEDVQAQLGILVSEATV